MSERNAPGAAQGDNGLVAPPTDDVSERFICKIDGPDGLCYIAWIGGMPEREYAFVYRDQDYHFYFYADRVWDGSVYDVDVHAVSVSAFTGASPVIREEHLDRIAANIKGLFEQRAFFDSSKPRPAKEQFRNLTFSWKPEGAYARSKIS
jgi:hypothetical protein